MEVLLRWWSSWWRGGWCRALRSHDRDLAAVDHQLGAGDEGGVIRGEERVAGRHLLGQPHAPQRDEVAGVGLDEVRAEAGRDLLVERGADVAGTESVDTDPVPPQLDRHGLAEQHHT